MIKLAQYVPIMEDEVSSSSPKILVAFTERERERKKKRWKEKQNNSCCNLGKRIRNKCCLFVPFI